VSPPVTHPDPPPPPEPPPVDPLPCPPGCILEHITGQVSQPSIIVDLSYDAENQTSATNLAPLTSTPDSVTHVVCTPRVCGLRGDSMSSVTICTIKRGPDRMVDGGANVCVTGDIGSLLDVTDIDPIPISVAIEGSASSFDNCITKRGVLPLSLSDGTNYFQMCYYCANMVETIISPAAVLASSDVFSAGRKKDFATLPSLAACASPAMTASCQCSSRYATAMVSITATPTCTQWTVTRFVLPAPAQLPSPQARRRTARPLNLSPQRVPGK
jgi:hypothetical protein